MERETRKRSAKLIVTTFVIVVIALVIATSGSSLLAKEKTTVDISKPARYEGAEQCKQCHEGIYEGWDSTLHSVYEQVASDATVIGDFKVNNKYVVKKDGKEYTTTMTTDNGRYYITTIGPDGTEGTYEVIRTIGSAWKQRYITQFNNGEWHVLPVQWNVKKQEWADYHGLKKYKYDNEGKYWSGSGRIVQKKCAGCHYTGFEENYNKETDTWASTFTDLGAGCEACHGPGSNHILASREDKAATIINPAKIPQKDIGSMVCGQCHNRGHDANDKGYGYAVGYKPGMNLNFMYEETPGLWPNGDSKKHHQQYPDWRSSKHFEAGVGCWDCHTVHSKGVANKFQTKLPGSVLCKSCHGDIRDGATKTHSIHDFGSCVDCHMPKTAKSMNPGDIRSHTFKPILPEVTLANGGLDKQPNSCNSCHHHEDETAETMLSKMRGM